MNRALSKVLLTVSAVGVAACGAAEPERPADARSLVPPVEATPAPESPARSAEARASAEAELPPTPLVAEVTTRDLGTVGIGDGLVKTVFHVTNGADEATGLAAAYTSCMCTEATLEFQDGTRAGPFGMPGHELPVTLERTLGPGEGFDVSVTFDPMAHGPDAVGPVHRAIALHSDNGGMLQLDFTVNVVKESVGSSGG